MPTQPDHRDLFAAAEHAERRLDAAVQALAYHAVALCRAGESVPDSLYRLAQSVDAADDRQRNAWAAWEAVALPSGN
jgi:hypothetical protein